MLPDASDFGRILLKTSNMAFIKKSVARQSTNCKKCCYKSENPDYNGMYVRGCEAPQGINKVCDCAYMGYWDKPFVPSLRKGDKVMMTSKGFPETGRIFIVKSDSQILPGGAEVVFCENLPSSWRVENFQKVIE